MAGNSILVINAAGAETRVALVENGTIHEYYLERKREKGIVGNIYKGRVVRVLPGMQAAFVDIGLEKAAFLYVGDVYGDPDFSEEFELTEGEHAASRCPRSRPSRRPRRRRRARRPPRRCRRRPSLLPPEPPRTDGEPVAAAPAVAPEPAPDTLEVAPGDVARRDRSGRAAGAARADPADAGDRDDGGPSAAAACSLLPSRTRRPRRSRSSPQRSRTRPRSCPRRRRRLPGSRRPRPRPRRRPCRRRRSRPRPRRRPSPIGSRRRASRATRARRRRIASRRRAAATGAAIARSAAGAKGARVASGREGRERGGRNGHDREKRSQGAEEHPGPAQGRARRSSSRSPRIPSAPRARASRATSRCPGRHLVFMPTVDHIGISRRIEKDGERRRLREIVDRMRPEGTGFIVRTVADGVEARSSRPTSASSSRCGTRSSARRTRWARRRCSTATSTSSCAPPATSSPPTSTSWSSTTATSTSGSCASCTSRRRTSRAQIELYRGEEPIFDAYGIEQELKRAAPAQGLAEERRLHHHRPGRGAHRHRRQLGPLRRQEEPRGDDHQDQRRGGQGDRLPAPAAQHRRHHHHRLHRHGQTPEPRQGLQGLAGGAGARQGQDQRPQDLRAGPRRDDAQARARVGHAHDERAVQLLRRQGARQVEDHRGLRDLPRDPARGAALPGAGAGGELPPRGGPHPPGRGARRAALPDGPLQQDHPGEAAAGYHQEQFDIYGRQERVDQPRERERGRGRDRDRDRGGRGRGEEPAPTPPADAAGGEER